MVAFHFMKRRLKTICNSTGKETFLALRLVVLPSDVCVHLVGFQETKKLGTLRQQIENYRLQMQKLESELIKESKRADRAEFDLAKKTEKLTNLDAEIEVDNQQCP